jgi:hypothetical protein
MLSTSEDEFPFEVLFGSMSVQAATRSNGCEVPAGIRAMPIDTTERKPGSDGYGQAPCCRIEFEAADLRGH